MMCFEELKPEILAGCTPSREEALFLLTLEGAEVFELFSLANTVTRKHFGDMVDTCSIANAKCGLCSENCSFCAQSSHHNAKVATYQMMPEEDLIGLAHLMEDAGANRFCIVTSGFSASLKDLTRIAGTIERIKSETSLSICTSTGHLTLEKASMLKRAGVTRIHHNLETSENFFPRICTTHSYEQRINTVKIAKEAGFEICCGGIIGLGETPLDRVELALTLKELDIDAVPLNIITPLEGTPLEHTTPPAPLEILKTIAVYRLLLPDKNIRLAGGRETSLRSLQSLALVSGANGLLLGNYLTTEGQNPGADLQMISDLGLQVDARV